MERIAVFGYASLVDPASAAATLGRPVAAVEPATLRGFRRRWSLLRDNLSSEKTFERLDDGPLPRWILGLNLEPGAGEDAVNGVLIGLDSAEELARLDLRELRYDRIEVGGGLLEPAGCDRVFAYRAKPENSAAEPPEGAVVMKTYLAAVEAAFDSLGELGRYRETTPPPPVETIEARLVRDRIPPGNPRSW